MFNISDIKGYVLEQKTELPGVKAMGYLLRHEKTGARVMIVDNQDDNKVFCVGFRTPPADDTGVPHILEHSVLCGSEKFPIKDPFIELVKGSLNTFLNAMTYPDKTVYPVASCNAQDFHNLMHVYLDAVFKTNIYKNDEILMQEGWHYEIDEETGDLQFNGVVYNEMKGVFSSPDDVLQSRIMKALLPDTPYAFESGGDPDAIPTLTKDMFLDFHARYYHPTNSYIYLYGDVDYAKELAFIDEEYLSKYDIRPVDSEIVLQQPFEAPVTLTDTFSVTEEAELTDNAYLSYNVVTGESRDHELMMAMQIIDYVVASMPGAPIKEALINAGIGKDVDSIFESELRQPFYSIALKNSNKGCEDTFIEIVEKVLKEQIEKGIDKKAVLSAINYYEFKYREANYGRLPKGLVTGLGYYGTWLYDDKDAFTLGNPLDDLASLKLKLEEGYFEQVIDRYILHNDHKAYVHIYPELGKNDRLDAELSAQLKEVKDSLTEEQLAYLKAQNEKLDRFQNEPSSEEDLKKIPMLALSDIEKKARPFSNEEALIGGLATVAHEYDTDGIVYMDFCFDYSKMPAELIPYATMLVDIFRFVDTANYSYNALASELNLVTGGLSLSTSILPMFDDVVDYRPYFSVRVKCLEENVKASIDLVKEIILTSKLGDTKRLAELISETRTRMDVSIPQSGHTFAANRALSCVDPMMAYKEAAEGIAYYEFLKEVDNHFEEKKEEIVSGLYHALWAIFRKDNLTVSLTGQFDFNRMLGKEFEALGEALFNVPTKKERPVMIPEKKKEGYKTSSKVQYVACAGQFTDENRSYKGSLRVLKTILSYDYLWNKVRVNGGAYGCMCGFTRTGYGFFTSYRDPNLTDTYRVYKEIGNYLRNFDPGERDMTKYIIGTISGMDMPMEAEALGDRSFSGYRTGFDVEELQKERDEVLTTTVEDIRALADYMDAIVADDSVCVIGEDKKVSEAGIFDSVTSLTV